MVTSKYFTSVVSWGILLWLVGYLAGIFLFFIVPKAYIGWIITPLATVFTIWILFKKINQPSVISYLNVGITWVMLAVLLDYTFLVRLLKATDYYQPDIFLYYLLTLILPPLVGYRKLKRRVQTS